MTEAPTVSLVKIEISRSGDSTIPP